MAIIELVAVHWESVEGRGIRVVVQCDEDRPQGLAFIVGEAVSIDDADYTVLGAEHDGGRIAGPLRKGENVTLWVRPAVDAPLPTVGYAGRA